MAKIRPEELRERPEENLNLAYTPPVAILRNQIVVVNASGFTVTTVVFYDENGGEILNPIAEIPYGNEGADSTSAQQRDVIAHKVQFVLGPDRISKTFAGDTISNGADCKVVWFRDSHTGNDVIVIMTTGATETNL